LQLSTELGQDDAMTYEDMTGIFHRMYPIAGEMDIPVETFVAGTDTLEARQLLDGLSVSQIEILQESHLQAYHYLNERKVQRQMETDSLTLGLTSRWCID
jgi:hypothetical protein